MKLRPVIKKQVVPVEPKTTKKTAEDQKTEDRAKKNRERYADVYKPMFDPIRFLVRETPSNKDSSKVVKQYLELSVKRYDDDEALPYLYIQMYQESEFYTGYLKGKTIYLPLEMLGDLMENLTDLDEECEKRHIEC